MGIEHFDCFRAAAVCLAYVRLCTLYLLALCTRTCSPWSALLSGGWKWLASSLLASVFSFSFFFFSLPLWTANFLLAGRIISSWDDFTLENHCSCEDLKLIPSKNNPSPQDTNRSLLLFELKWSGVYSRVCDVHKQTIRVVTLLQPNTRTVILTLD